eukprot:TRINITY_DN31996_c0_g1_i1.p1 TRINITY_DN31996_c0_g1~~TRINITY_DN31996_c0_g1_i1.p1  ORF type:complete len:588 (+),score=101.72 TRINITY_DN31996_c0_g1_i1:58-1821(+)
MGCCGSVEKATAREAAAAPSGSAPAPQGAAARPAPAVKEQPVASPNSRLASVRDLVKRRLPEFISRYSLGDVIGEGRATVVFACTERDQRGTPPVQLCAKVQRCGAKDDTKQVDKEIEALTILSGGSGVVTFHDGPFRAGRHGSREDGNSGEWVVIVLNRAEGGCLKLQPGVRWPEKTVARVALQLLRALNVVHSEGMLAHLDVKPSHVLFDAPCSPSTPPANVVLTGFGCATPFGSPHTGALVEVPESPLWIAPEVWKIVMNVPAGEPFDERCDMWSLGAVLYGMLSGTHPVAKTFSIELENDAAIVSYFQSLFSQPVTFPEAVFSGVSASARHFLLDLLQIDFRSRSNCAQALHHPWMRENSGDLSYLASVPRRKLLFNFDEFRTDIDIDEVKSKVGKGGLEAPASPFLCTGPVQQRRASQTSLASDVAGASFREESEQKLRIMRRASDNGQITQLPPRLASAALLSPFVSTGSPTTKASRLQGKAPQPLDLPSDAESSVVRPLKSPLNGSMSFGGGFGSPQARLSVQMAMSPKLVSPAWLPKERYNKQMLSTPVDDLDDDAPVPTAAAEAPPKHEPPAIKVTTA